MAARAEHGRDCRDAENAVEKASARNELLEVAETRQMQVAHSSVHCPTPVRCRLPSSRSCTCNHPEIGQGNQSHIHVHTHMGPLCRPPVAAEGPLPVPLMDPNSVHVVASQSRLDFVISRRPPKVLKPCWQPRPRTLSRSRMLTRIRALWSQSGPWLAR